MPICCHVGIASCTAVSVVSQCVCALLLFSDAQAMVMYLCTAIGAPYTLTLMPVL